MGIEQAQLLAAVHGVEGVVDVEHDPLRHLPEGGAVEVDHRPPHRHQLAHAGQVLQPADRRLRRQIPTRRQRILGHLEDRIGTQPVGVVAVLVAGGDHLHAEADHVGQAVDDLIGAARIVDAARQTLGDTQPPLHLGQSQNATVRRQHAAVETGDHGLAADRRQTAQRQRRIAHGGCGLPEMARIGLSNQILRHFNGLFHIRQPASRVEEGRGGLGRVASLRFPSPLIKPDVRISRIRLSDWLHRKAHGGDIRRTRRRRQHAKLSEDTCHERTGPCHAPAPCVV